MKTMFKVWAVIAMTVGLFSCNNDDGPDSPITPPGILGNAETYATIRVAMPSGEVVIKATPEGGDGVEAGSDEENKFNSVSLYFFHPTDDVCMGTMELTSADFGQATDGAAETITYTTSKPKKIGIVGTFDVYAVVNGKVEGVGPGTSLTAFVDKTVEEAVAIKSSDMLMTNSAHAQTVISETSTEKTPASLSVTVERTAAKITYTATQAGNKYTVTKKDNTVTDDMAQIVGYRLVNLRTDSYLFRKRGGNDGNIQNDDRWAALDGNNYVIDNKFKEKTPELAGNETQFPIWRAAAYKTDATDFITTLPTAVNKEDLLTYCMENTMPAVSQLNGYTTGIVFKAVYQPKEILTWPEGNNDYEGENKFTAKPYAKGTDFYRYAGQLYADKDDIVKFFKLDADTPLIDTYTGNGESEGGAVCYYTYWIKHNPNTTEGNLGIMEYGIVRNNAYKLKVTQISGLGDATDPEIDPDTPDEKNELYIKVDLTILPWVVRNNDIIL